MSTDAGWGALSRASPVLAAAVAAATFGAGLHWNTRVAGGSDSYCYVSQAGLWADGTLLRPQPIDLRPPWPEAALTLAPTGYVPSPVTPGAISPICPSGLALTMAPLWKLGGPEAVYAVVPALGALAVWLAFLLGRALGGPQAGLMTAVLTSTSPIALYQLVQPMSDVPAVAWWLAAIVLASRRGSGRQFASGVLTSLAILTRPNLAPLAIVVAAWLALRPRTTGEEPRVASEVVAYGVGLVPGVVALAWIQNALYGSPIRSGYGAPELLFAWSHLGPNLARYPGWLIATQTPILGLAVVAPLVLEQTPNETARIGRSTDPRWLSGLCLALAMVVTAAYLFYVPFDDWWYVRFLLPAIPLLLAPSAAVLIAGLTRLPVVRRGWGFAICLTGLAGLYLHAAVDRDAFALRDAERRFVETGRYLGATLPAGATVLTVWHSGAVRHYGQRLSILWDSLDPAWLDRALAHLQRAGRPPYLLFESWEEPRFRDRFRSYSSLGALDWPPMAQIGRDIRLYNPADRARYLAGDPVRTERVWLQRNP